MLFSYTNPEKPLTLGILGGGQLAKMLALDAYRMGLNVAVIENDTDTPAGDMTKQDFPGGWSDRANLDKFIEASDIITLENEFIDPEILDYILQKKTVYPSPATMRLVQDKYIQKQTFENAGIPVPKFAEINTAEEAKAFGTANGYPYVIKARKYGYDGYGNATVFSAEDVDTAWERFKGDNQKRDLMAEKFVDFTKELAVIVARNVSGETEVYPCVETIQYKHICHAVIAEAEISDELRQSAREMALKAVESINGIGVFGVELFLTSDNQILINEIAPRPHNSGHYTIEGCYTSQFENGIRAVCNLPLGSSKLVAGGAAMVNLLGERDGAGVPESIIELMRHKKVWLHLYNKKQSRRGRKMGHITAVAPSAAEAHQIAESAAQAIKW
jgi:5-(carboxyamino)imidazole ribonucleotide synthase